MSYNNTWLGYKVWHAVYSPVCGYHNVHNGIKYRLMRMCQ